MVENTLQRSQTLVGKIKLVGDFNDEKYFYNDIFMRSKRVRLRVRQILIYFRILLNNINALMKTNVIYVYY